MQITRDNSIPFCLKEAAGPAAETRSPSFEEKVGDCPGFFADRATNRGSIDPLDVGITFAGLDDPVDGMDVRRSISVRTIEGCACKL